jgi:hypothetical protein
MTKALNAPTIFLTLYSWKRGALLKHCRVRDAGAATTKWAKRQHPDAADAVRAAGLGQNSHASPGRDACATTKCRSRA